MENIREPKEVEELLFRQVEASKDARRMRPMELVGNDHHHDGEEFDDPDYDDMD